MNVTIYCSSEYIVFSDSTSFVVMYMWRTLDTAILSYGKGMLTCFLIDQKAACDIVSSLGTLINLCVQDKLRFCFY